MKSRPHCSYTYTGLAELFEIIHLNAELYTNQLDWVDWFESIHFSAKLIGLIQFIFQASWLVIESIRFHKVGIESIDFDCIDW